MSMISEQVKELRKYAGFFKDDRIDGNLSPIFKNAADTIETLSTKLQAANMERSERYYGGGWIAISERLPTKEESIKNDNRFILDDGNMRYGGLFDYEKKCFVKFDFWKGLVEDKCVIAWQPLPERYNP